MKWVIGIELGLMLPTFGAGIYAEWTATSQDEAVIAAPLYSVLCCWLFSLPPCSAGGAGR
jgi:hypothetical protein